MAVGPLGKASDQPILRGEDETAVLVVVAVLEDTQELQASKQKEDAALNFGWASIFFGQEI